jgi:hypothetical protein
MDTSINTFFCYVTLVTVSYLLKEDTPFTLAFAVVESGLNKLRSLR